MFNLFLIVVVCISLAMSLFIGIYALFRSQSFKKNYFLLMQTMVIVFLFGYLLELISTNAEEAYTGVKVLYVGAYFVAVFAFFFATDYCNIKLHPVFVKAPMLLLALVIVLTMWTTKFHHLVYLDYGFDTNFVHRLIFTPGPLYSVFHHYPTVCMILTMAVLFYQLKKWKQRYRKQIILILVSVAIPFIAEGVYFIATIMGTNKYQIYFTPHSLALMCFCLYVGVMRFNLFEVISMATVTAMEHIREGFILVDECNNYLYSNSAAAKILPGIKKLAKGESVYTAGGWPEELKNAESDTVEFSTSDNGIKYFRASVSPVVTESHALKARIILLGEITDSVILMKELENAAYMDALTGLYNRKHFFELSGGDIERALRLNQAMYTAMLDLDFFKNVNDTYGHAAGDMVLKATAAVIRQTIRSYDLLCRYGGEEFALLITDLEPREAYKLMERIRENMEHHTIHYEGNEIKITCSIGLAKFNEDETVESSLKKADEALYEAKHSGRNQVKIRGSFQEYYTQ